MVGYECFEIPDSGCCRLQQVVVALGVGPRSMGGFSWLLDGVGSVRYHHLGGADMGIYNRVWGDLIFLR